MITPTAVTISYVPPFLFYADLPHLPIHRIMPVIREAHFGVCQMTNEVRQKKLVRKRSEFKKRRKQVIVNGVLNCSVFIASNLYDIMIIHRRNMKLKVPVYDCIHFNKKLF